MDNQWTPPACGTLRISNPMTLQRWIDTGKYQEYINDGWIFNVGCGRFRKEKCTCTECRNKRKAKLQSVIDNFINTEYGED